MNHRHFYLVSILFPSHVNIDMRELPNNNKITHGSNKDKSKQIIIQE